VAGYHDSEDEDEDSNIHIANYTDVELEQHVLQVMCIEAWTKFSRAVTIIVNKSGSVYI
jgi:hypothetical protein